MKQSDLYDVPSFLKASASHKIQLDSKKLILFDLDGTLAESKSVMDSEMSHLLSRLLDVKKVGIISGGSYLQFEKQLLTSLKYNSSNISRLYLFPTCSTTFYMHVDNSWKLVYSEDISSNEQKKIYEAFEKAFHDTNYQNPETVWGEVIENRLTQITFSGLGQKAPLYAKINWDPTTEKRTKLKEALLQYIPEFEVRIGGTTSIDVTRKGIDKAYGVQQIEKHLGITKDEILFIGDALFEGGNDYPVKIAGVDCIKIANPDETKIIIRNIINP